MTPKTFTHEDFSTTTGDGNETGESIFALAAYDDTELACRRNAALTRNVITRQKARQVQIAMQNRRPVAKHSKIAIVAIPPPRFFVPSMLQDQEDMRREELANEDNPLPDLSWPVLTAMIVGAVGFVVTVAVVVIWRVGR